MTPYWRRIQAKNFNSLPKLAEFLEIDATRLCQRKEFPLNLPVRLAQKIQKGDFTDPLLRQFVPLADERSTAANFVLDPTGDSLVQPSAKLLHKYQGRALLVCTSACAMHCRYCFRQHFDYASESGFQNEIELITQDPSIEEVLLSGGDPLSLSDATLGALLEALAEIPHVRRIRFHSRFPIGIPERIDPPFLRLLEDCPKQVVFVVHCNHPRELDADVLRALQSIHRLGVPVLNQSVLLRGVNDSVEVLRELCELLIDHGLMPYYLHQLDRVQGAAHFEVSVERGLQIIEELHRSLPGYAVPQYVQEISGQPGKTALHAGNGGNAQEVQPLLQNSSHNLAQ